jgi:serine/threonine protein kinase
MTTPASRIADAEIGRSPKSPLPTSHQLATRIGAALASPLGILLAIPGLVALLGGFLTLTGENALRGSNLDVARERLSEQTRLVADSVKTALAQADPVLDRLANLTLTHGPGKPLGPFAHALADLIDGRPGIAYLSVSFPDGTFQGAYLEPGQPLRFQDSRVAQAGTQVRRYNLMARDELSLWREESSHYDPRQRAFYKLAETRGERVWTDPYPFYGSHATGVTRTQPVYAGGKLHAVITVDFDVNALSSYLGGHQLPGMRALLYAHDGTILAYPAGATTIARLPQSKDRTLRPEDLNDPLLTAFFRFGRQSAAPLHALEAGGRRYLSTFTAASGDPALGWFVAYLAPEDQFLHGLRAYERQNLLIGACALLLAVVIGFLFARHITRVRKDIAQARSEAQAARSEARELGSYRLVACLGKGGMGEVWRAEHRLLARQAAIKLIRPEVLGFDSEGLTARFRREAEALASLRSRNTIELFDYGVAADGTFFFVMELLDGMDLESLVQIYGPQPAARAVYLLLQVCNSLAEAHDANFVHRDIKPANLFICRAGDEVDVVKVLDFGLVRAGTDVGKPQRSWEHPSTPSTPGTARLTYAGGMMGTPGYMPPEQALGQELDGRADLYALGCVAVFLLSGKRLFPQDDPVESLAALLSQDAPDPRPLLPEGTPAALIQLIAGCVAKRPEDRPAGARVLARALRELQFAPEQGWNEQRASAWWERYCPRKPASEPPDRSQVSVANTLVAARE